MDHEAILNDFREALFADYSPPEEDSWRPFESQVPSKATSSTGSDQPAGTTGASQHNISVDIPVVEQAAKMLEWNRRRKRAFGRVPKLKLFVPLLEDSRTHFDCFTHLLRLPVVPLFGPVDTKSDSEDIVRDRKLGLTFQRPLWNSLHRFWRTCRIGPKYRRPRDQADVTPGHVSTSPAQTPWEFGRTIQYHEFITLHVNLQKALNIDFERYSSITTAVHDWHIATHHHDPAVGVSRQELCQGLFNLALQWVPSLELDDLTDFLAILFFAVARRHRPRVPEHTVGDNEDSEEDVQTETFSFAQQVETEHTNALPSDFEVQYEWLAVEDVRCIVPSSISPSTSLSSSVSSPRSDDVKWSGSSQSLASSRSSEYADSAGTFTPWGVVEQNRMNAGFAAGKAEKDVLNARARHHRRASMTEAMFALMGVHDPVAMAAAVEAQQSSEDEVDEFSEEHTDSWSDVSVPEEVPQEAQSAPVWHPRARSLAYSASMPELNHLTSLHGKSGANPRLGRASSLVRKPLRRRPFRNRKRKGAKSEAKEEPSPDARVSQRRYFVDARLQRQARRRVEARWRRERQVYQRLKALQEQQMQLQRAAAASAPKRLAVRPLAAPDAIPPPDVAWMSRYYNLFGFLPTKATRQQCQQQRWEQLKPVSRNVRQERHTRAARPVQTRRRMQRVASASKLQDAGAMELPRSRVSLRRGRPHSASTPRLLLQSRHRHSPEHTQRRAYATRLKRSKRPSTAAPRLNAHTFAAGRTQLSTHVRASRPRPVSAMVQRPPARMQPRARVRPSTAHVSLKGSTGPGHATFTFPQSTTARPATPSVSIVPPRDLPADRVYNARAPQRRRRKGRARRGCRQRQHAHALVHRTGALESIAQRNRFGGALRQADLERLCGDDWQLRGRLRCSYSVEAPRSVQRLYHGLSASKAKHRTGAI